jgi:hypothetical protein
MIRMDNTFRTGKRPRNEAESTSVDKGLITSQDKLNDRIDGQSKEV